MKRIGVGIILFWALTGCSSQSPHPDALCSASETYDALGTMMVSQVPDSHPGQSDWDRRIRELASLSDLKKQIKFVMPTLEAYDATTKKASCNVALEIEWASGTQPPTSLPISQRTGNVIRYRGEFSVQPSADTGKLVYTVSNPSGWGSIYDVLVQMRVGRERADQPVPPRETPALRGAGDERLTPLGSANSLDPAQRELASDFDRANARCRGSEDGQETEKGCEASDAALKRLNAAGLCWGRTTEVQAEYAVHVCGPDSIR